jgi:hypothetical protein
VFLFLSTITETISLWEIIMKVFCKAAYLSAALVLPLTAIIGSMGGGACAMEGTAPIADEKFLNQLIAVLQKGGVNFGIDPEKTKTNMTTLYTKSAMLQLPMEIAPELFVTQIMPIIQKMTHIKMIYLSRKLFDALNADVRMRYLFFKNLPSSVQYLTFLAQSESGVWNVVPSQMNQKAILESSKAAIMEGKDYIIKKGTEKKFLLGEITGPQIGTSEKGPLPEGVQQEIMEMMAETTEPHKAETTEPHKMEEKK